MDRRRRGVYVMATLNLGCGAAAGGARWLSAIICVGILLPAIGGCQEPQTPDSQEPPTVTFANAWLKGNLSVELTRSEVNSLTGLYEVDALLRTDRLEPGRRAGYRIVARTVFWQGDRENIVDEAQWCELLLEPELDVEYTCTSLRPADGHVIEIAYPEDVDLR
jgi:hypothetical protein